MRLFEYFGVNPIESLAISIASCLHNIFVVMFFSKFSCQILFINHHVGRFGISL